MAARYEVTNFTDVRGDVIYFWLFVDIFIQYNNTISG